MYCRFFRAIAVLLLLSFSSVALTQIPISGNLSGILQDTTYLVVGDISIQSGDSLTIESGAVLLFDGSYRFEIAGYLSAIGTYADTIKFIPRQAGGGWQGMEYSGSSVEESRLEYCLIVGSGETGIECNCYDLVIDYCTINGNCNYTRQEGGGIYSFGSQLTVCYSEFCENDANFGAGVYANESNITVSNCYFSRNESHFGYCAGVSCRNSLVKIECSNFIENYSTGGCTAINCEACTASIIECTIIGNEGGTAGGIFTTGGTTEISHCTINENISYAEGGGIVSFGGRISQCVITNNGSGWGIGGGIFCYGTTINNSIISGNISSHGAGIYGHGIFEGCIISNNTSSWYGGGISASGHCCLSNCTICGNSSDHEGGGVYVESGDIYMANTIAANNTGIGGIYFDEYTSESSIIFCNFFNNQGGNFSGPLCPPELGIIDTVNTNNDSCDMFFNIFENPMFVHPDTGNLHLHDSSRCIGAGDPATPPGCDIEGNPRPDPPGSYPDIGAYEHRRDVPLSVEMVVFEAIPGDGWVKLHWETASETDNDHFVLYRRVGDYGLFYPIANILGQGTTTIPHEYNHFDHNVINNITYQYQISDVDINGVETIHDIIVTATPVAELSVPTDYSLSQNWPNPFNTSTRIRYAIKEDGVVSLTVYDLLGHQVTSLVNEKQTAGIYYALWNAADQSSGIYFCLLKTGDFRSTRKMLLVK